MAIRDPLGRACEAERSTVESVSGSRGTSPNAVCLQRTRGQSLSANQSQNDDQMEMQPPTLKNQPRRVRRMSGEFGGLVGSLSDPNPSPCQPTPQSPPQFTVAQSAATPLPNWGSAGSNRVFTIGGRLQCIQPDPQFKLINSPRNRFKASFRRFVLSFERSRRGSRYPTVRAPAVPTSNLETVLADTSHRADASRTTQDLDRCETGQ